MHRSQPVILAYVGKYDSFLLILFLAEQDYISINQLLVPSLPRWNVAFYRSTAAWTLLDRLQSDNKTFHWSLRGRVESNASIGSIYSDGAPIERPVALWNRGDVWRIFALFLFAYIVANIAVGVVVFINDGKITIGATVANVIAMTVALAGSVLLVNRFRPKRSLATLGFQSTFRSWIATSAALGEAFGNMLSGPKQKKQSHLDDDSVAL